MYAVDNNTGYWYQTASIKEAMNTPSPIIPHTIHVNANVHNYYISSYYKLYTIILPLEPLIWL